MQRIITVNRTHSPGRENPRHAHDMWEIVLYTGGSGSVMLPNREQPLIPGDIYCFPPGNAHGERSEKGYDSMWIMFDGFAIASQTVLTAHDPVHAPFRILCDLLYHEFRLHAESDACKNILSLIIGYITRFSSHTEDDARVEAVKSTLIANIGNPDFRLRKALASFGCSTSFMHAHFKKVTGVSPLQYLIDLRIRDSKAMLSIPKLTLRTVARQVGFRDPYHFSRAFKQKTGMSPADFRSGASSQRRKAT
ncbi:MAG: AraC family transcriptional regulator [Spirochaetes bacterium]|nr:AraC family transcriptional regulator [Spirochaetota bacterium]